MAVICGCNAGLYREALHDVYLPRIQRGNASFAANVLGARAALLRVLVHFFEHGRWGSPAQTAVAGQSLTAEDQLFILMEAGHLITAIRGMGAPEAGLCYDRAESLARSLKRFPAFYLALVGQWRHSLNTVKLSATVQIAKRLYALAQDPKPRSPSKGQLAAPPAERPRARRTTENLWAGPKLGLGCCSSVTKASVSLPCAKSDLFASFPRFCTRSLTNN